MKTFISLKRVKDLVIIQIKNKICTNENIYIFVGVIQTSFRESLLGKIACYIICTFKTVPSMC